MKPQNACFNDGEPRRVVLSNMSDCLKWKKKTPTFFSSLRTFAYGILPAVRWLQHPKTLTSLLLAVLFWLKVVLYPHAKRHARKRNFKKNRGIWIWREGLAYTSFPRSKVRHKSIPATLQQWRGDRRADILLSCFRLSELVLHNHPMSALYYWLLPSQWNFS